MKYVRPSFVLLALLIIYVSLNKLILGSLNGIEKIGNVKIRFVGDCGSENEADARSCLYGYAINGVRGMLADPQNLGASISVKVPIENAEWQTVTQLPSSMFDKEICMKRVKANSFVNGGTIVLDYENETSSKLNSSKPCVNFVENGEKVIEINQPAWTGLEISNQISEKIISINNRYLFDAHFIGVIPDDEFSDAATDFIIYAKYKKSLFPIHFVILLVTINLFVGIVEIIRIAFKRSRVSP